MSRLSPLLVLAPLSGVPLALWGQETVTPPLATATEALERSWSAGDVDPVVRRLDVRGVSLHLPGVSHPSLSTRLARAALEDLHRRAGRGRTTVREARVLGGQPPKAFLEMEWLPRLPGMNEPFTYTVFAGFEVVEGVWRIVEIRVLPGGDATAPDRGAWR